MTQAADLDATAVVDQGAARGPSGFGRYLATKIGGGVVSLVLVVVLGFFLFRVLPGDPVRQLTGERVLTQEQIEALREKYGLDDSRWTQFVKYVTDLFQGDFGQSYKYPGETVGSLILDRLWPTILLVGTAAILSMVLGIWQGTRAAWRHGSTSDRVSTGVALTLWSVPTFWLGLLLLMAFGGGVGPFPSIFPTGLMESPTAADGFLNHVVDVAHHMVLPCITLVAVVYAQYLLVMRSSLLDEMGNDYLITARAKGLRDDLVRRRHAVPNALLPTVTLIFLQLGFVVSGAVTVEVVYSWPGLGSLLVDAIDSNDLPLMQGTFLVFSASVIVMNVLADIVYRFLDPRVRAA